MKFSIEGFSQEQLLEHSLDYRDAVFLRWFADFQQTGRMKVFVESDLTYYWLRHAYVAEQIPIIGLTSETGVRHYLKRLVDSGVLHRITRADSEGRGSRAFYCIDSAIWRALTEKVDQRPAQAGGQPDQRPTQDGDHTDQRPIEDGGHEDQRPTQDGAPDDQRPAQAGGQPDQRPTQDALIPPSSPDSSFREEEDIGTTRASEAGPPPPKKCEETEDPIKKLGRYIAHYVPAFQLSDQTTIRYIRTFVDRYGSEELEKVARAYVQEKKGKLVTRYFITDFPERLGDAMRSLDRAAMKPCGKCKRSTPAGILIDGWIDGLLICPECAAKEKARLKQEKNAS